MQPVPLWRKAFIGLVLAFGFLGAMPNVIDSQNWSGGDVLPAKRLSLGLDLRGGAYILLEMQTAGLIAERVDGVVGSIRSMLREQKWRAKSITKNSTGVAIEVTETVPLERFGNLLQQELGQDVEIITTQGSTTTVVQVQYTDTAIDEIISNALNLAIETVRRRIDETGTTEPVIQQQGTTRIAVQMPGVTNPARIRELIGATAKLSFHLVNPSAIGTASDTIRLPDADQSGQSYNLYRTAILSGENLQDASATFEEGQPIVSFRFDTEGARKFGQATTDNVGQLLAIVLDDEVISAPRIQSPILGGSGIITGNFTVDSADDLALLLRSGALPAPMEIIEERTVGPTLGSDSVQAGLAASIAALIVVLVFMSVWYGRFGIIASIGLIVNIILLIALLSSLQATLTLPGIAGIVLTMGMAVDANVLVFERIREERTSARNLGIAIHNGFERAFTTIMDANLTTLFATIILLAAGSGPIRGFAITLSFGIICSLFTTLMLTRFLLGATTPKRILQAKPGQVHPPQQASA